MPAKHASHFTFDQSNFRDINCLRLISKCLQKQSLEGICLRMIRVYLQQFFSILQTLLVTFCIVEFLNKDDVTASCLYACASLFGSVYAPLFIIKVDKIQIITNTINKLKASFPEEKVLLKLLTHCILPYSSLKYYLDQFRVFLLKLPVFSQYL